MSTDPAGFFVDVDVRVGAACPWRSFPGQGRYWRIRAIRAGRNMNGDMFPGDVLRRLATRLRGTLVRRNGWEDHRMPSSMNAADLSAYGVGWVVEAWFTGDAIEAIIETWPHRDDVRGLFASWWRNFNDVPDDEAPPPGFSICCPDGRYTAHTTLAATREAWQIDGLFLDIVTQPAAYGRLLEPVEYGGNAVGKKDKHAQPDTAQALATARETEQEAERIKGDLEARQRELTAALPELQQTAGGAIFEATASGDDPQAAVERLARVHAELAALPHAIAAADGRVLDAKRHRLHAQAADCRHLAAEADMAADAHEVRTQQLLAELLEHEGAVFEPQRMRLVALQSAGVYVADPLPPMTRTAALRTEAAELRRQADAHEEQAGQAVMNAARERARAEQQAVTAESRAHKQRQIEREQQELRQAAKLRSERRQAAEQRAQQRPAVVAAAKTSLEEKRAAHAAFLRERKAARQAVEA